MPKDLPVSKSREIPLTRGLVALVDDEDFAALSAYKWSATHCGYARRWIGGGRHALMHRELLGFPSGMLVDHINGDPLDNRRENLRIATAAQNIRNQKTRITNTSGYKGVQSVDGRRGWKARIRAGGRQIYLGYFSSPELAHAAYCDAAKKYHGEFARMA